MIVGLDVAAWMASAIMKRYLLSFPLNSEYYISESPLFEASCVVGRGLPRFQE